MDITGIQSMQEDDQHKIWVSSNAGIYRIDPLSDQITVYSSNYEVNAGGLAPAGYKGEDGKIYFGESGGYYVLSPERFINNSLPPKIVISDFSVTRKPTALGGGNVLGAMPYA